MIAMMERTQLTVPCSGDYLHHVREVVRDTLHTSRVPGMVAREIEAGVNEAVTEVMLRSYAAGADREVDLEIALYDEKVQVSITNDGACFDPEAPTLKGGSPSMGIELITKVFDDIRHSYADYGLNHLVMTRNLRVGPS
jgi:anti-sigma regulatory factor (Ser/Thr protein kinase)